MEVHHPEVAIKLLREQRKQAAQVAFDTRRAKDPHLPDHPALDAFYNDIFSVVFDRYGEDARLNERWYQQIMDELVHQLSQNTAALVAITSEATVDLGHALLPTDAPLPMLPARGWAFHASVTAMQAILDATLEFPERDMPVDAKATWRSRKGRFIGHPRATDEAVNALNWATMVKDASTPDYSKLTASIDRALAMPAHELKLQQMLRNLTYNDANQNYATVDVEHLMHVAESKLHERYKDIRISREDSVDITSHYWNTAKRSFQGMRSKAEMATAAVLIEHMFRAASHMGNHVLFSMSQGVHVAPRDVNMQEWIMDQFDQAFEGMHTRIMQIANEQISNNILRDHIRLDLNYIESAVMASVYSYCETYGIPAMRGR